MTYHKYRDMIATETKQDLRKGEPHYEEFCRHQNRNKARYDDGDVHVRHVHVLLYNFSRCAFHHSIVFNENEF